MDSIEAIVGSKLTDISVTPISKLTDITVTPIPLSKAKQPPRELPDSSNKWTYDPKAFNLPPQTQISPVITSSSASSRQRDRELAASRNSDAQAAAQAAQNAIFQQQAMAAIDPLLSSQSFSSNIPSGISKYAQLLMVIEEMGRDIRPSYSGSRSSAERLKRGIVHARILVRECLMETEKSARS